MDNTFIEANRKLWNLRTEIHVDSRFYDVEGFIKGKSSLSGIELEEMGPLDGKSLLHLQCHFGQDTLSLAREGATVTGVDFSEKAIDYARELAKTLDLPATFVCSDVFELPNHLEGKFDIVFSSFGVLGWLEDLDKWAGVINHFLKPGGFFYLLEFHPIFQQYGDKGTIEYDYFPSDAPDEEIATITYTDGPAHAPQKEYWFLHTLSEVIVALNKQGLSLEIFREFPFSTYKLASTMVETSPGKWVYENLGARVPYLYSVRVRKKD